MNPISNSFQLGFNPNEMLSRANENLKSADVDGSGGVSKTEITEAMGAEKVDPSRLDKIFSMMDADKNGEISAEEQQGMLDMMQQKMAMFSGGGQPGSASNESEEFDPLKVLMDALNPSDKENLLGLKEKYQSQTATQADYNQLSEIMQRTFPKIDERA